ncbi:MAG: hypothetical protein ACTSUV_01110 [Candidatus Ranarchaeia archaeon]
MNENFVKIVFFSPFRKFMKEKEMLIEYENNENFENLVKKLVKKFGKEFEKVLLNAEKKINDWVMVLRNGTNISSKDDSGFSLPLSSGQEYVFCSYIEGGTRKIKGDTND